ncbi:MAG: type II toxin-antitoxin system ParD family antitoxin [Proteobacteria bacterium]|nr:type II toxin-antitoxin system ParD family antitoxin [Pseudomonadota bacterium]
MATLNISLPDPMRNWIKDRVDEGKYSTSSDYVRDLMRRDQDRKQKIEAMQLAITKGLESEDVKDFDMDAFTKRMLKESQIDG